MPRLVRTRRHLFPSDGLQSLIRTYLRPRTFAELAVPFAAVATAASTGATSLLRRGLLEPALLASAAIPGVFPRVLVGEEWFFDGGLTANVPLRQAFDFGAASALVLNAAPPPGTRQLPTNIAETVQYAVSLMMRNQASAHLQLADAASSSPVVRLPQTSPPDVGVFDFSRAADLIDRAYEATATFLGSPDARLDALT